MQNESTYRSQTGSSGVAFKCTPRFPTLEEARGYLDDFWILRQDDQVQKDRIIVSAVLIIHIGLALQRDQEVRLKSNPFPM